MCGHGARDADAAPASCSGGIGAPGFQSAGPCPTSWRYVSCYWFGNNKESERGRSLPVAVAVRSWLRRIVIGDGLCPWAEDAVDSGALAVVCLVESDEQAVAARLLQHGDLLARAKPPGGRQATTLCLAPRCHELRRTRHFHKVCDFLDLHLDETKVQLAPFHPKWRFLDRRLPGEGERPPEGSDAADFVNRAPVPAFHFLRVSDVEGAAASHSPGDWEAASASVALRNAQLLRKRGAQSCAEALQQCREEGLAAAAKADAPAPADPKKVEEPAATPKTDATAEPAAEPPVQASGAKADAEEVSSQKGDAPKAEVPVEQKIQEAPVQAEEVPIEQKVQEAPAEAVKEEAPKEEAPKEVPAEAEAAAAEASPEPAPEAATEAAEPAEPAAEAAPAAEAEAAAEAPAEAAPAAEAPAAEAAAEAS
ncbi:unnamed protein product [Effrenium voratum]|nr:unnamed protein product [Effrenium voratum]